jgi:cell wall-associated NlpC family hydrolase
MINITPDRIITEARKFLNVPFFHRGRSVLGLDCLGLIIVSFRKCSIIIPSDDGLTYYSTWWRNQEDRLHDHLKKYGFEEVEIPQRGDIITFKLLGMQYPAHHSGILISEDTMIHVNGLGGAWERKCKINRIPDSYKRRLGSYFRYKGYV